MLIDSHARISAADAEADIARVVDGTRRVATASEFSLNGENNIVAVVPMEGSTVSFLLCRPVDEVTGPYWSLFRALLGVALLVGLIAVILSSIIARRISTPIGEIADAAQRIAAGDFRHRVTPRGRDEIATLAESFVKMSGEIEALLSEVRLGAEKAQAANRAKSAFLATMSHEIRTPMNGVLGMLDILRSTDLSTKQVRYVDIASSSAESLLALLSDVLDLSKIEAERLELREEPFDLLDFLQDLERRFRFQAEQKGYSFFMHATDDLPRTVLGDAPRLGQVLSNLLSNAVKFTSEGEVRCRVRRADASEGLVGVTFEVSDTGAGIPAESIEHLFESFYQADNSSTREHGGSGLGLAICRSLVELMNGSPIEVESHVGRGSTFRFTVPLPKCKIPDQHAPFDGGSAANRSSAARAVPDAALGSATDRPPRVLLVDDVATNRRVGCLLLELAGCEPAVAEDGRSAVEAALTEEYDVILMDWRMPDMDGLEATRQIRERESRSIPIVAVTANAVQGDRQRCLGAGMNDYIAKPLSLEQLVETLNRHLPDGVRASAESAVPSSR